MQDAMHEAMFEFAKTVQRLIHKGWTLGEIDYGERRLGLSPSILLTKDGQQRRCYSEGDFESILLHESHE